jgi:hypothetical protein
VHRPPSAASPAHRPRGPVPLHTRTLFAAALLLLTPACSTDATEPDDPGDLEVATLEAPIPVSAAVLRLEGVASVAMEEGRVFTRADGAGLRAVFLLDRPGTLAFTFDPSDGGAEPSATVIEVADEGDRIVPSTEGYRVRFGS